SEPLVPLRVLRNRTAALMIIASAAVGIGMFGGATFLGQYFQLAKGYTPTHAGLMIVPLMAAMLVSSTLSGQIITRPGRWKAFLLGGGVMLVAGLTGCGTLTATTPDWHTWVFMALMGLGMGAMMQNIVLAVQNTIDVRDIGAASATLAFFRTLGGAIGVSVLGAVLAAQVQTGVRDGLAARGIQIPGGSGKMTLDLSVLPPPVLEIVRNSYGDATGHIFWISAAVAVVALIAVILVREVPLRTTVELKRPETEEATVAASSEGGAAAAPAPVPMTAPAPDPHGESEPGESDPHGESEPNRESVPVAQSGAPSDGPDADPADTTADRSAAAADAGSAEDPNHGSPDQRNAEPTADRQPFEAAALDDPTERLSVAALDVLAAAQARSREQAVASDQAVDKVRTALDQLEGRIDNAIGELHQALAAVRDSLCEPSEAASLGRDGVGGHELRSYEYGLLINSQRTADRVTGQAQEEAERMLTEARTEVADLEARIEQLRKVEAKLQQDVGARLRDDATELS